MKPYEQFTSGLNNFRATLIPEHVIGCDFMFNVFNLNTNLKVGTIDGEQGFIRPQDTDSYLSANQLRELAALCDKIEKSIAAFI